jgi:phosphate acetyltransferase
VGLLDTLTRRAALAPRRLVLPEGEDPRIVRAAAELSARRLAHVTLLGDPAIVQAAARAAQASLVGVEIVNAKDGPLIERTRAALLAARGDRIDAARAAEEARRVTMQAACLVREGFADAFVAGATHATSDVLRAAIFLIGMARGVRTVASYFAMVKEEQGKERILFFADGGVVPDPDAAQLADIAVSTADRFRALTQQEPHVAMLSFSTKGSAQHVRVDKVRAALELVRRRAPTLAVDGELQADAALSPEVAAKKLKEPSAVAGQANVLIFPDLDSGNIGYKLAQWLGGAQAIGPFLQGFAKPVSDLSRGASVDDIVTTCAVVAAMG